MTDLDTIRQRHTAAKAALRTELDQTVLEQASIDDLWAAYDEAVIDLADALNDPVADPDYDDLLAATQDALIGYNLP